MAVNDERPPSLISLGRICDEPYGFWLDSVLADDRLGQNSFWGTDPFLILRSSGTAIELWTRGGTHRFSGSPFETLRQLLRDYHHMGPARGASGGAVGYFAYELKRFVEKLPQHAADDLGLPECYLCFYKRIARFDPRPLAAAGSAVPRHSPMDSTDVPPSSFTSAGYKGAVQRVRDYIFAGDIYQANLSQRFHLPLMNSPFDVYLQLRSHNPAPFSAYINLPEVQLLSASPERFLRFDPGNRRLQTRPIKGTRPRGRTEEEDEALARKLLASEKDRAENVMIVDLERNDLGRVAEIGSVRVTELASLETLPTVFHLASTVEATLREDRDVVDLLLATFPGGSITGAPKIRAMEIIDELEPTARSVYTGAIGYLGFDGSIDLNIAIRTILVRHGVAYFQAGGGIVADSDPEMEYQETLHKASALRDVLIGSGLSDTNGVRHYAVDISQR
ncbi:MAG: aminodeoxychorismate synthase component I [Chloroflexi bacterium]|nr:aminodeoxychorismate synthase component I [Chloroflexota bacterium]